MSRCLKVTAVPVMIFLTGCDADSPITLPSEQGEGPGFTVSSTHCEPEGEEECYEYDWTPEQWARIEDAIQRYILPDDVG